MPAGRALFSRNVLVTGEHDGRVLAAEAEGVHLEHVDVNGSWLVQHDVEAHGWIEVRRAGYVGKATIAHGADAGDDGHGPGRGAGVTGVAKLGYDAFRPGQREAVVTLIEGGRLLLVAPTGGHPQDRYDQPRG